MKTGGKGGSIRSYRLVKPYLVEKWGVILLGLFSLCLVDMLQLFVPRIIKWVVDDLTVRSTSGSRLFEYAAYIVGVALCIGLFRFFWRRCLIGTSRRVEEGLRNQLFSHIQTLSVSYFDKTKTGDLMAHATNDVQHVRMAFGMGMVALTDAIVLGFAAVGFMLYINVELTLLALLPMPVIAVLARIITRRMHHLYKEAQASFAELTETVREGFAGIRVVKAYNREQNEAMRLSAMSKDYVSRNLRLIRVTGAFFPGMVFFSNLSVAIVLYLGGRQAINLTITPGDFVAFISYLGLLTWPMMAMGWVINLIQRGAASLDRINVILETKPDVADPRDPIPMTRVNGDIVFDQVGFRYGLALAQALTDVSFRLNAGQTLGVVGPTGCGKTTLCHLIPRLFDVTEGSVLIDGMDVRRMSLKALRANVAVVPQTPFLFSGTIRENLCFGNEHASEAAMASACEAAQFYETIIALPDRFDTMIGEKGVTLSGGQRQRLALARALLVDTPILVLDDPLSQVDTETAAGILAHVRKLCGHRTTVIVSHRISHVRHADIILVLENGKTSGLGTHEELMAVQGFYSKMYRWQEIEAGFAQTNG